MTQQEFSKRYVYDASTDELGGGGFAHVYKAWDNEEECFVALKIQPVDSRYPDLRLKNEVDRAASLRHPNVARYKACYTFSTFDGNKDIAVMSYYEHGSLDKLLCSQRLTDAEREDILKQILAGVDYLHSQGIIHRDLKPQNILVLHHGGRYVPKITDFGISKQLADGESSAVHNSVLGGTYSYASPEQLKETTIRKNTDLWSFGVIAYQMFAGVLPFNCGTFSPTSQEGRQEQFRQMTSGVLPEALNNIPEPWQTLIRECLVVDNTQRLTHVEDCVAILNNQPEDVAVDESTIVETPMEVEVVAEPAKEEVKPRIDTPKQKEQPKSNIPTEPAPKNSKWWLWLLLLLIAVGGFVGYMMSGGDNPEPILTPAPTFTLDKSSLTVESSGGSDSVSYTIENPAERITSTASSPININGHTAVDLGLSVKWATCNVGATRPEDYGNYYAWGETSPKTSYTEDNSKTMDKSMGDIGGDSRYDAATANWGSGWRLPTKSECDELIDNCTWTWTKLNGVKGYEVKSKKNGNSIFLPAAGFCNGDTPDYQGSSGYYWSSTHSGITDCDAYYLYFDSGDHYTGSYYHYRGRSVRPVAE